MVSAVDLTEQNYALAAHALRANLSAVLEALTHLENHEKPALLARYQVLLGGLELDLTSLQLECAALRCRLASLQAVANRGAILSAVEWQQAEQSIEIELSDWRAAVLQQEGRLQIAQQWVATAVVLEEGIVQTVKASYRRLARLLHPDVSPENNTLFVRYWESVQQAYLAMDAELLTAILHVVEEETQAAQDFMSAAQLTALKSLLMTHSQRLAQLQSSEPFCYAALLDDEVWVEAKRAELNAAVAQWAAQQAALLLRYISLKADTVQS